MDFDVAVLGGGISGLGVARELTERGKRVVVLEANGLGNATSNNTLRIIHGGFRYLQQLDLLRMMKSLKDQRDLLIEVPDALKVLPCVMPLNRFGLKSALPVWCASTFYGAMLSLLDSSVSAPRILSKSEAARRVPFLAGRAPYGALLWHDVVMQHPERIISFLAEQIQLRKGVLRENTKVKGLIQRTEGWEVTLDRQGCLTAHVVVSTLGPWVNQLTIEGSLTQGFPISWCKGINVSVASPLDSEYAIGVESRDGRLFFVVPREGGSTIGTWYVPVEPPASPTHPATRTESEETNAFLDAFNKAVGYEAYAPHSVLSCDVGVLPMTRIGPRGPELVGNERYNRKERFVEVLSTKYTTFRSQGRKVAEIITRL